MRRSSTFLLPAVLFLAACATCVSVSYAQFDCGGQVWPPPDTFVYGKEAWWAVGDTVQFVGDSGLLLLGEGGCSSYDQGWGSCHIDTGFTFRRITDFDDGDCSYTPGDTCYMCKVRCCFFWATDGPCGTCSCGCNPHDLCKSFWKVVEFYQSGPTGRGCYESEFVSDCADEACESGTSMCSTVSRWDN
jgi:hypothetical protein